MSLKKSAFHGVKWTTLSTGITIACNLGQVIVLARLLAPSELGVITLLLVVVQFTQRYADLGISSAIVQRRDLTTGQLSSLYWLNVLVSIGLWGLLFFSAPLIAQWYDNPELSPLLRISGVSLVIQGLGQQYRFLLQKELQFKLLSIIDAFARAGGVFAAIITALLGYGAYAIAWSLIVTACISSSGFLIRGIHLHRPQPTLDFSGTRPVFAFGFFRLLDQTLNYLNSQTDALLIGKILGVSPLGYYNLAKQPSGAPATAIEAVITKVSFPIMAKVQHNPRALRRIYCQTLNNIASLTFPFYALLCVYAETVVMLIFGEQWLPSVPVLQILCIFFAIRSTGSPIGTLLLARGRAKLSFQWNLTLSLIVPLVIFISCRFGLKAAASSLAVLQATLVIPSWHCLAYPLCGVKFWEYHKNIVIPALIAGAGALFAFAIRRYYASSTWGEAAGILGAGLIWIISYKKWNRPFMEDASLLLKGVMKNRSAHL